MTAVVPDCEQSVETVHAWSCSTYAADCADARSGRCCRAVLSSAGNCALHCRDTRWPCSPWPSKTPKRTSGADASGIDTMYESWFVFRAPSSEQPASEHTAHTERTDAPFGAHSPDWTTRCLLITFGCDMPPAAGSAADAGDTSGSWKGASETDVCVDPRRCASLRAPAGGDGVDVRPCESGFADGFLEDPRGVDPFFEPERGVVPLDGRERGDAGRPLRDGEVVGIARCDAQNSRHQK